MYDIPVPPKQHLLDLGTCLIFRPLPEGGLFSFHCFVFFFFSFRHEKLFDLAELKFYILALAIVDVNLRLGCAV